MTRSSQINMNRLWKAFHIAMFAGLMVTGSCLPSRDHSAQFDNDTAVSPHLASFSSGKTFVQLFEWRWEDVARECETFLSSSAYGAVQISPPNEHRDLLTSPWWQRYQPVSYRLESRSGTEEEFKNMIARCHAVGVHVYADAVINHMAGGVDGDREPGVGWAKSTYSKYDYPGLFTSKDFNKCRGGSSGVISNYQNRFEVQNCELVELSDLNTSSLQVQTSLSGYLNKLFEAGVDGLRIDASKHIPAEDLAAILEMVPKRRNIFFEVIEGPSEPIKATEYSSLGRVTEFQYAHAVTKAFRQNRLVDLFQVGGSPTYLPSESAVVFIDNHDTQRGHGAGGNPLTFKEPTQYKLANIFLLSWPYGQPVVMSSFGFRSSDQGPPADQFGLTKAVHVDEGQINCGKQWICEHRWPVIEAMVRFRKLAGDSQKTSLWSGSPDQIAFAREGKGFIAINGSSSKDLTARLQTSLPEGSYCNVININDSPNVERCPGGLIDVDSTGHAEIKLQPLDSLVIHVDSLALKQ